MDTERVAAILPQKMEPRTQAAAVLLCRDSGALGDHLILYSRDSVELIPAQPMMETGEEREKRLGMARRTWGAVCSCTACGEDFIAGWLPGGMGIRLFYGEAGDFYPGYCEQDDNGAAELMEDETLLCPMCGVEAVMKRRKRLAGGRTWRCMVQVPQAVEAGDVVYTVVLGWIISREVNDLGGEYISGTPGEAIVLDERRRLHRYVWAFRQDGTMGWVHRKTLRTLLKAGYYSADGGAYNMRHGALMLGLNTGFAGETAEKSGLADYLHAGGEDPTTYLKLWCKHPYVENLVHTGLSGAIVDELRRTRKAELPWADLRRPRPTDMVGMTKDELRTVASGWNAETARCWRWVRGKMCAAEYAPIAAKLQNAGGLYALEKLAQSGEDLTRAVRYLRKQQHMDAGGMQMLLDLWQAVEQQKRPLTDEVRWPRDLQRAHDRETEAAALYKSREKSRALQAGFDAIREKYGALEWTDGDLCIRLPRGNEELIAEGETLRHCVGGYGKDHVSGRDVIFFVRHYRRPERSYYTLDIRMNHGEPREVQLHGYGNEHHGEHKQYRHRIPPAVRAFCNRWEKEVLLPWYGKQRKSRKTKREESAA